MSRMSQRLEATRRERVVKNPLPWYTPRFWHGMRLGAWLSMLVRNRFNISLTRLHTLFSITGVSCINSGLSAVDRLLYSRRVSQVELTEDPLFILGHWRSGTTFLHELLIRDPAHTFPNTYQCFAPHHFIFTESWIKPWTEGLLPSRRPMDNMAAGWQRPQEDEFALGNLGIRTPYLSMAFPQRGPKHEEYLDLAELSPDEQQRWRDALTNFFRRIAYHDNRRIVVKSPPHTARVKTLVEMFPRAKFVHIVRDPFEVFVSTVNLWKSLHEVQRMQELGDMAWLEEYVLRCHERMYTALEADRQLLGENQLIDVHYEQLIDQPLDQLRRVYEQLELGDFSRVEPAVTDHLADVKNYRKNHYELDDRLRKQVQERWAGYFERYGYQADPVQAS